MSEDRVKACLACGGLMSFAECLCPDCGAVDGDADRPVKPCLACDDLVDADASYCPKCGSLMIGFEGSGIDEFDPRGDAARAQWDRALLIIPGVLTAVLAVLSVIWFFVVL